MVEVAVRVKALASHRSRGLLIVGLLLCPLSALAHDADIVYAKVMRKPGSLELAELLTLTAPTLNLLAPVDADRDGEITAKELAAQKDAIAAGMWDQIPIFAEGKQCERTNHAGRIRQGFIELYGEFRCEPGELTQTFKILSVLPSNYRVVLGALGEGGQLFTEGQAQTLVLDSAPESKSRMSLLGWIHLGVIHIFTGYDHLAFLIALLVVGGSLRSVLWMVTAFTVAHSLTLGATALDLIPLSESAARWVEVAIAASIVWVALENLIFKTHRRRAAITFAFGLIHGFGFASVLTSYGLGESVSASLLGFNVGVNDSIYVDYTY